ncbi:MAG: hypothetical protein C5B50_29435 [Verrucomicrobia bacterium]|nr:MAG: hypothetical protein C5B50_29435 [Verrucomicrobiota bacterium]
MNIFANQRNIHRSSTALFTASVLALGLLRAGAQSEAVPGTLPANPPDVIAPALVSVPLAPVYSESGALTLSLDGMGTLNSSGNIRVQKPAGATVRRAFLGSATTGNSSYQLAANDVTVAGQPFVWSTSTGNSISSYNYWGEVTSIVKPILDAAAPGIVNLTIGENNSANIDGEVLAVVFDDPNVTSQNTVSLLFGAQNVAGDTFSITFAQPLNPANTNLVLDMSLGISYGYQSASVVNQYSIVNVNGQRLTSSAGGQDDGQAANGALITVGGIGDTDANPPPLAGPSGPTAWRTDDELYNLVPFITNGTTSISVYTLNPSSDDNIFFAGFFLKGATAIVGQGILLTPVSATNVVGATHHLTAQVVDTQGQPVVSRTVTFTVVSGPNAGVSGARVTDTNGFAFFSYVGITPGLDTIQASFVDNNSHTVTSSPVRKLWVAQTKAFICPTNATVQCGNDTSPAATGFASGAPSGFCTSTNVFITFSDTNIVGNCPGNYTILRTWTATDTCSNSSQCVQTIQVVDTTAPSLFCFSNKTVACGSPWHFDRPNAFDACCGTNVTIFVTGTTTNFNGPCGSTFTATRSWIAMDCCGNTNGCSQTVSVVNPATVGGSIFLTGHDPDFHAFLGGNTAGAAHINQRAISFIMNPAFNPYVAAGAHKFLFVESSIAPPPGHTDGVNGIGASGYVSGTDFDRVDASGLNSALNQLGTVYGGLVVASDFGGILTQAELDILNARAGDIANFVNTGGGLYAMAESDSGAGLTPHGGWYKFVPIVTSSTQFNQTEVGNTVTPFGASLGLVNSDVNGNASHAIFVATGGLNVVDLDPNNDILSLAGRSVILPPPLITCASNKTVECSQSWDFDPPIPGPTNGCCGASIVSVLGTTTNYNGHCGNTFDATRTWFATDCCSHTNVCSQTVNVVDTTPPSIACPPDTTVSCSGDTTPTATGFATACDSCGSASSVLAKIYSGNVNAGGGAPYSGFVGSVTSSSVSFATDNGYSWHPFGLANYGADITGCLIVATNDVYTFTLNSDDGSLLLIDGTLVVDNGGVHPPATSSGTASLTAGAHSFEVQFFECCDGPAGVDLTLPSGVTYGASVPTTYSDVILPGSGNVKNVIQRTWTATDACSNSASCTQTITVTADIPCVVVTKICPPSIPAGIPVFPVFGTVVNCSAVALTNVVLVDDNGNPGNPGNSTVTQIGPIPAGGSVPWTGNNIVPTGACGPIVDTVVAIGTGPCGDTAQASAVCTTAITTAPCLAVTKTANDALCGQPIAFSGTVSNCGNSTINNISVADTSAGNLLTILSLPPGGSVPYSGSHTGVVGTNTDTVCATGTDACSGTNVSACATAVAVVSCPVPLLICPQNITVSSTGQCQAVTVNVPTPVVTNTCAGVVPLCTRSDGKALTNPYPVGITTISCTVTDLCGQTASCSFTVTVTEPVSIVSNFNGTPIPGGSTVWFSSVVNVSRHNICPETITFFGQTITSSAFTLVIPDGEIDFVAGACPATTSFVGGKWVTTVGCQYTGRVFISGFAYQVPAAGLPGGINPVTWSGTFLSSTPGVTLQWLWAAAAYSSFSNDNNEIGVKPVDGSTCTTFANSDHAGTPEYWKSKVIGGARGGGGSNWTGSLSGTLGLTPCVAVVASSDVKLTIQMVNGQIQLSWPSGTLQEAGSTAGPYSDVAGATSPYIVSPSAPQKVYRVRVQ